LIRINRRPTRSARPSSGRFGVTSGLGWLADGIPIDATIRDPHAALFGHGAPEVGTVKASGATLARRKRSTR
jgi:glycerol kinase